MEKMHRKVCINDYRITRRWLLADRQNRLITVKQRSEITAPHFYVFIHFKIVSGICVSVYAPVLP